MSLRADDAPGRHIYLWITLARRGNGGVTGGRRRTSRWTSPSRSTAQARFAGHSVIVDAGAESSMAAVRAAVSRWSRSALAWR